MFETMVSKERREVTICLSNICEICYEWMFLSVYDVVNSDVAPCVIREYAL